MNKTRPSKIPVLIRKKVPEEKQQSFEENEVTQEKNADTCEEVQSLEEHYVCSLNYINEMHHVICEFLNSAFAITPPNTSEVPNLLENIKAVVNRKTTIPPSQRFMSPRTADKRNNPETGAKTSTRSDCGGSSSRHRHDDFHDSLAEAKGRVFLDNPIKNRRQQEKLIKDGFKSERFIGDGILSGTQRCRNSRNFNRCREGSLNCIQDVKSPEIRGRRISRSAEERCRADRDIVERGSAEIGKEVEGRVANQFPKVSDYEFPPTVPRKTNVKEMLEMTEEDLIADLMSKDATYIEDLLQILKQ